MDKKKTWLQVEISKIEFDIILFKVEFKKLIVFQFLFLFFTRITWSCLHMYFLKMILNFCYINFRNLRLNPLNDQGLNQNMNYVDWKTLTHPRFFITFENRKWTTLIRIMYYGMDLIRLVSPRNETSNLRSSFKTYFKA